MVYYFIVDKQEEKMTDKHPLEPLLEESRKTDPENIFRGYKMFLDHIEGTDFRVDLDGRTYLRVVYYQIMNGTENIEDTDFSDERRGGKNLSNFIIDLEETYRKSSGNYVEIVSDVIPCKLSKKYSYSKIKYFFEPVKFNKNLKKFTESLKELKSYNKKYFEYYNKWAYIKEKYLNRYKDKGLKEAKEFFREYYKLEKKVYNKIGEPRLIIAAYLGQTFNVWEEGDPLEPEFTKKHPISEYVLPRSRIILYKNPKIDLMRVLKFLEYENIPSKIEKLEEKLSYGAPFLGFGKCPD